MGWKLTDYYRFFPPVSKFHVAKEPARSTVFVTLGSGGKGSEYHELKPEQALELARYLTVAAHRSLELLDETRSKGKK